jgi:hypothetical protein
MSAAATSLLGTVSGYFHRQECGCAALPDVNLSPRSAVLFLWKAAPWEPEIVMLVAAAGSSAGGPAPVGDGAAAARLMDLWADRHVRGVPRPPVDGESLMRELGLAEGPLLGKALRDVRLAWEAGEARTGAEALAVARGALERPG